MDFEPCFKDHNFVSVHPKSIKLGQMTNLTMIFHVVVIFHVSLLIAKNLKLALAVPCTTLEWPIARSG